MFYWHEASLGNDSFCVLPSHHPGVVTTSCNGCIFQEIFSWYFSPKCFVSKQHFVNKILCHFDPCPVSGLGVSNFLPSSDFIELMALGNGCWYKYSQLQRFIHSLQSQPSLQWAQWQLNGVTLHEGNTRKTWHMSYEPPWHRITSKTYIFWTQNIIIRQSLILTERERESGGHDIPLTWAQPSKMTIRCNWNLSTQPF